MDYTALGGKFLIWCLTSNPGRVENHSKGEVQIRLQIHKKIIPMRMYKMVGADNSQRSWPT